MKSIHEKSTYKCTRDRQLAGFAGLVVTQDAEATNTATVENSIAQTQEVEQPTAQPAVAVAAGDGDASVDQSNT